MMTIADVSLNHLVEMDWPTRAAFVEKFNSLTGEEALLLVRRGRTQAKAPRQHSLKLGAHHPMNLSDRLSLAFDELGTSQQEEVEFNTRPIYGYLEDRLPEQVEAVLKQICGCLNVRNPIIQAQIAVIMRQQWAMGIWIGQRVSEMENAGGSSSEAPQSMKRARASRFTSYRPGGGESCK